MPAIRRGRRADRYVRLGRERLADLVDGLQGHQGWDRREPSEEKGGGMSRSYEWRLGHDSVIRYLDTVDGCKGCVAKAWMESPMSCNTDYALGMLESYRFAAENHSCCERGERGVRNVE